MYELQHMHLFLPETDCGMQQRMWWQIPLRGYEKWQKKILDIQFFKLLMPFPVLMCDMINMHTLQAKRINFKKIEGPLGKKFWVFKAIKCSSPPCLLNCLYGKCKNDLLKCIWASSPMCEINLSESIWIYWFSKVCLLYFWYFTKRKHFKNCEKCFLI